MHVDGRIDLPLANQQRDFRVGCGGYLIENVDSVCGSREKSKLCYTFLGKGLKIRPLVLECCYINLWGGHYWNGLWFCLLHFTKVQNRATKMIQELEHLPYED